MALRNDAPVVERHSLPLSEVLVVRDDLLPGGSKTRFLSHVLGDAREIVFGGPFCGGAPVALAFMGRELGRKVTLFYAKRGKLHRRQEQARAYGATLRDVPMGFMSNVQAKARVYAQRAGALFLPLGFDVSAAEEPFVAVMRRLREKTGPMREVWCAAGSGMLTRCLARAFPEARVCSVPVGLASRWSHQDFPGNVSIRPSLYSFEQECKTKPPFPSCPNYDAKAWELCVKYARGSGVLFWNVMGP